MKSFVTAIATLAAAVSLAPLSAAAAPLSFLNNTIAARIPAKDLPDFKSAVAQVLNETADGAVSEWTSRPGRNRQPVQIMFRPQQTVQTKSAGACRLLAAEVRQRSVSENWRGWLCKQTDGSWKASGSQQP